jgi:hypothetical protein
MGSGGDRAAGEPAIAWTIANALLLVERLKHRTHDPDVLTLCDYVHGTDVHGTIPAFRRPVREKTSTRPVGRCPIAVYVDYRSERIGGTLAGFARPPRAVKPLPHGGAPKARA